MQSRHAGLWLPIAMDPSAAPLAAPRSSPFHLQVGLLRPRRWLLLSRLLPPGAVPAPVPPGSFERRASPASGVAGSMPRPCPGCCSCCSAARTAACGSSTALLARRAPGRCRSGGDGASAGCGYAMLLLLPRGGEAGSPKSSATTACSSEAVSPTASTISPQLQRWPGHQGSGAAISGGFRCDAECTACGCLQCLWCAACGCLQGRGARVSGVHVAGIWRGTRQRPLRQQWRRQRRRPPAPQRSAASSPGREGQPARCQGGHRRRRGLSGLRSSCRAAAQRGGTTLGEVGLKRE